MFGSMRESPSSRRGFFRRGAFLGLSASALLALAACGGGGGGGGDSDPPPGSQNPPPSNAAPQVDAGADQTITLPTSSVELQGSATDSDLPTGSSLTYAWTGPEGVTFADASAAATTATFAAAGSYELTLTADDGAAQGSDTVTIVVNAAAANAAPTANAGDDQTITLPMDSVQLQGSGEDDGLPGGSSLAYAWSGPEGVTFAEPETAKTTASFAAAGTYELTLAVSDGEASASDTVVITVQQAGGGGVNIAPIVDAGVDQTLVLPATTAHLLGTGDDDGLPAGAGLTYAWASASADVTIATPDAAATDVTLPATAGSYEFTLTVSDGELSASDSVTITVSDGAVAAYPAADDNSDELHGWEKVDAASVGMDPAKLAEAEAYAVSGNGSGTSGLIARGGRLVHSWGAIDWKFDVKSTTKSIGGMTLGLAMADGLVAIGDNARMRLPTLGDTPAGNDPAWLDQITLLQLATHTAGFRKSATDGVLDFQPGTTWSYSDAGLNWLSDVLTQVYAADMRTLLFERVLTRIGLTFDDNDVTWRTAQDGRDPLLNGVPRRELASGIRINANGMARVGLLFLRRGVWANNERLLSEEFVDLVRTPRPETAAATNPQGGPTGEFPTATQDYGVLWWTNASGALAGVPTDAYWAWGLGDSLIVVIPSLDLVIARAGETDPTKVVASPGVREWNDNDWNGQYDVLEGFLRPIVESISPP